VLETTWRKIGKKLHAEQKRISKTKGHLGAAHRRVSQRRQTTKRKERSKSSLKTPKKRRKRGSPGWGGRNVKRREEAQGGAFNRKSTN